MPDQPERTSLLPEIIAHRGASYDAPENTLAAIRRGFEQGADAVEIDVRLSRDGHIVLMHDETTRRTAGEPRAVAEQSLAELRTLDAGKWKGGAFAGEPIPTLDEVIATIPPGKRLVIEVKCGPEIVPALVQTLGGANQPSDTFCVIAFVYPTLAAIKNALPDVPAYWLSGYTIGLLAPDVADLITGAREASFDGLNLGHRRPLPPDVVRQIHDAGLKCLVWTVDDAKDARRLAAAGVDGITTNRPGWLREQLQPM